jgi:hypothetical protein
LCVCVCVCVCVSADYSLNLKGIAWCAACRRMCSLWEEDSTGREKRQPVGRPGGGLLAVPRKRLQRKARKRRTAALRTWSVKRGFFAACGEKMRPNGCQDIKGTEDRGQGTGDSPKTSPPACPGRCRLNGNKRLNERPHRLQILEGRAQRFARFRLCPTSGGRRTLDLKRAYENRPGGRRVDERCGMG